MNRPSATDLLFAYGTLCRAAGDAAHRLLADSTEIASHGIMRGRLPPEPVSCFFLLSF